MNERVPFLDKELLLQEHNGIPYTSVQDIVEGIGYKWDVFREKRLTDDLIEDLRIVKFMAFGIRKADPSKMGGSTNARNGAQQHRYMIPINYVPSLAMYFKISKKISSERAERIRAFRRDCYDVLADYWSGTTVVNYGPGSAATYTLAKRLICRASREPGMEDLLGMAKALKVSATPCFSALRTLDEFFEVGVHVPKDEVGLARKIDHYLMTRMSIQEIVIRVCNE